MVNVVSSPDPTLSRPFLAGRRARGGHETMVNGGNFWGYSPYNIANHTFSEVPLVNNLETVDCLVSW